MDQDNVHALETGKLLLIDNQIDQTTSTIRMKAIFPNAEQQLWPGEFVRAQVLVERVRANFPGLEIVSRARNVSHYFELRLRGVTVVERETFESALKAGRAALEKLGVDPFRAKELADAFRRHNVASVDATLPFYQDEARRMSMAKAGREELEQQFARDRERFEREHGGKRWK